MNCPICISEIDTLDELYTTNCNHSFHHSCLKEWVKTKLENNDRYSCPCCRNILDCCVISNENNLPNYYYKTKNIKRKSITINHKKVFNLYKQLQDQVPKAWYDFKNVYIPIYKLKVIEDDKESEIFISAYLRAYLLYGELKDEHIWVQPHKDFFGKEYFTIIVSNIKGKFSKSVYLTCLEWCIEVFHVIKHTIGICYRQVYNTILSDMTIKTMIDLKLENNMHIYQGIFTCAIYNILKKFCTNTELVPSIEYFISMTDDTYVKDELLDILKYQENYLKNEISILDYVEEEHMSYETLDDEEEQNTIMIGEDLYTFEYTPDEFNLTDLNTGETIEMDI